MAELLSVTTNWLYHLAGAGVGPKRHQLRGSRRWYYLRSDVDAWVLSGPDLSPASERVRRWREQNGTAS